MTNREEGFYSYFIDTEKHIAYVQANGRVSYTQSVGSMEDVAADPAFEETFSVLVDLSRMEFHPTFTEFSVIKDNLIRMKSVFKGKIALVMVGVIKTMGDLAAELARKSGLTIRVFYSKKKAEEWLMSE